MMIGPMNRKRVLEVGNSVLKEIDYGHNLSQGWLYVQDQS